MQLRHGMFAMLSFIMCLTVFASLAFATSSTLPDAGLTQDDFEYQDVEKTTIIGIKPSAAKKILEASKAAPKDIDGSSPVLITIPEGTERIVQSAFNANKPGSYELVLVKAVTFPTTLKVIDKQAFQYMPLVELHFNSQPSISRLAFFPMRNYVSVHYFKVYELGKTYSPVSITGLDGIKIAHYVSQRAKSPVDNNDGFTKDDGSNNMTILKSEIPGENTDPYYVAIASYKGEEIYQTNAQQVKLLPKHIQLELNGLKLTPEAMQKYPELKDNRLSITEINNEYLHKQTEKLQDLLNYLEKPALYYDWVDEKGNLLSLENLTLNLSDSSSSEVKYILKPKGMNKYGLDANGGKFSDGSKFKEVESLGKLSQDIVSQYTPKRDGYAFLGWKLTGKTIADYKPKLAYAVSADQNSVLRAQDFAAISPNSVLKAVWQKSESPLLTPSTPVANKKLDAEYTGFYSGGISRDKKSEAKSLVEKTIVREHSALPKTSDVLSAVPLALGVSLIFVFAAFIVRKEA